MLCNRKAWVSWNFKRGLGLKKLVRNICWACVGLKVIGALVASTTKLTFIGQRHLYACKACGYQTSLTAGTIFHKTRTPLRKWFWMIFLMGRQKSGASMLSLQRILEIRTYKTVWVMGHKIRKAMAERDAGYKLAGLIEMDDTYIGGPKPGKHGRGAAGKSKVLVAVETLEDKPRFAAMRQVPRVSSDEIKAMAQACLAAEVVGPHRWLAGLSGFEL